MYDQNHLVFGSFLYTEWERLFYNDRRSVIMNNDTSQLIHKQIILDLTMRTLERDKKHVSELKMQRAFS